MPGVNHENSIAAPFTVPPDTQNGGRLPFALIGGSVFLLGASVIGVRSGQVAGRLETNGLCLQALTANLSRADENLTLAARLAVVTGEARWTVRYEAASTSMNEAMRQAALFGSDALTTVPPPSFVPLLQARLSIEQRAIALARAGRGASAQPLFDSAAYEAVKEAFTRATAAWATEKQNELTRKEKVLQWGRAAGGGLAVIGGLLLAASGQEARRRGKRLRNETATTFNALRATQGELAIVKARAEVLAREATRAVDEKRLAEQQKIEADQRRSRQLNLLEEAFDAANDVVIIAEAEPSVRVVRINQAFERMTGYTREEAMGRSLKMLQGIGTDEKTVAHLRERLRAALPVRAELLNYRKDGSEFWVELNIQPIFNEKNQLTYWISVQRDITERRNASERIWWQANYDPLTGLPNRALYQIRLAEAVEAAQRDGTLVGVLFFDLDRFKQVNDSLGHLSGDLLLQQIAWRLEKCLQGTDTIARIGGDEFTILLPGLTEPEQAAQVARKLLDILNAPFVVNGHELFATASIGVSIAPRDGADITALLKNADTAMYRAKEQGRDSFRMYNEAMNARALDSLHLENHLRRALDRNELYLLYQPQVDLETGEVRGVEALMRWESPTLGRISPGQFIPVAETLEEKLIYSLGKWTILQACRQASLWYQAGRRLRVSVNLSARQFAQVDLPDLVQSALNDTGLPPELLDIEITESTLVKIKEATETLHRLKAIGVRLSVDDFGIGYSSLSYLRTLPLDVLKIDRSFVIDLGEDRRGEAVVQKLVELSHDLGLEVIAEGVETEAQRRTLGKMRCDLIQGYLFSPPTTAAEVEVLADEAARFLLPPASVPSLVLLDATLSPKLSAPPKSRRRAAASGKAA